MKLIELFDLLKSTAIENKLSIPYIVGGFPRDILLKKVEDIKDVDITCGDNSSLLLGQKLVRKIDGSTLITFSDGHSRLTVGNLALDFSNNFRIPNIKFILNKENIKYNKEIYEEIYSRDFTANTLLMPLDMSTIIDITRKGIKDIHNKTLDTCLDPAITLGNDPKRIIRVVYLCTKLGFKPSNRIVDWIKENGQVVSKVNSKYIKTRINNAIMSNKGYAIQLLSVMNLIKYIPETETLRNSIIGV